jgi:MFS family permease
MHVALPVSILRHSAAEAPLSSIYCANFDRQKTLGKKAQLSRSKTLSSTRQRRSVAFMHRPRFTAVLAQRDLRWFAAGYATSRLGSAMAPIATAFAALSLGGARTLGWLMAARILPVVLFLLLGGVLADRLGSRRVMIAADVLRCAGQAAFAALLLAGHPSLVALLAIVTAVGIGEGAFTPSLPALIPQITARDRLTEANALLSILASSAQIAGPVLGGLLAAAANPAAVLLVDAASYGVSVVVLLKLHGLRPSGAERASLLRDLCEGWTLFASRAWLWIPTLQFCLFNALVWAPYLVLGPLVAQTRLGGASAWGFIMAANGAGAVGGGLLIARRKPRRPLLVAMAMFACYAAPLAALASPLPLAAVCVGAFVAGLGGSAGGALSSATTQRLIPLEALGRISAWETLGAFALGPIALAAAGPVGSVVGVSRLLAFGAVWQVTSIALTLLVPSVRQIRFEPSAPVPEDALV